MVGWLQAVDGQICTIEAPARRKMVEAVGVEPTSFARSTRATTCLAALWVSPARLPIGRPSRAPAFMSKFRPPARRLNRQAIRCRRFSRLAESPVKRRGQLSRECQLFVGSYVICQVFNEASRQPRHAAHAHSTESNPFRPHRKSCVAWPIYRPVPQKQAIARAANRYQNLYRSQSTAGAGTG
jgi:hypothetical protein